MLAVPGLFCIALSAGSHPFGNSTFVASISSISSGFTGPYLRMRGWETLRSSTVDSMPILHGPPSRTGGAFSPNNSSTWAAWVGLVRLDGFALGAATGCLTKSSTSRKSGCAGERRATVFPPAVISLGTHDFLGNTMVRAPGQNASHTFFARSLNSANNAARSKLGIWTIKGLFEGLPLSL